MWKEAPRTRKKEVLSSHLVESSRPSFTTVSLKYSQETFEARPLTEHLQFGMFVRSGLATYFDLMLVS